ncbi:MAG: DUF885 family protein [Verrucomicrobia bacterium]|jgi:hypothetical protein|nr:DUF885 family protein [Verrucomicrobiota bacterium]
MSNYDDLIDLCDEFRNHAEPDISNGAADYSGDAMSAQAEAGALGTIVRQFRDIHPDLVPDVERAKAAVENFGEWLQEKHDGMQESYDGIGVTDFYWCMANVHFVPFTWKEQREVYNEHPIRHRPPLYNLWAFRSEGLATAFEETMLQTGFLDGKPRGREITYVLIAFRAAPALGGMMLQSKEWTLQQAIDYSAAKTPRGWADPAGGVILGDLGIYLQQPEYGTSYLTGRVQFDRLMAECAYLRGDKFNLKSFMDEYFSLSTIPASSSAGR